MARLPTPGSDKGDWGDILNNFLAQAHEPDGSLKAHAPSHQYGGSDELALDAVQITSGTIADARIPATIARDSEVSAAITAHEAASNPHPVYVTSATLAANGDLLTRTSGVPASITRAALAADSAFSGNYTGFVDPRQEPMLRHLFTASYDALPAEDLPVISVVAAGSIASFIASGSLVREKRISDNTSLTVDVDGDTHFAYPGFSSNMTEVVGANPTLYVTAALKPGGASQAARWHLMVEFETTADKVAVKERAASTDPALGYVAVNGRRMQDAAIARTMAAGSSYYTCLQFSDNRPRRIAYSTGSQGFGGVYVPTGFSLVRPTYTRRRYIAVVGDSHTNGAGGVGGFQSYARRLSDLLGADIVIMAAIGGTRWVPLTSGTADELISHFGGSRLDPILAQNPDAIVFLGSVNDSGQTPTDIQAAVTAALARCAAVPEIYVTGTFRVGTGLAAVNTAVKAGTIAAGRRFVDLNGIIYGTGYQGSTTGDGNADYFIQSDTVHLTTEGQKFLCERMLLGILTGRTIS